MNSLLVMIIAAFGLVAGMANPWVQLPVLVLLYPAGLTLLGAGAGTRAAAFRTGWLTGILGGFGVLYWVALPVREFGGLPWPLAVSCALAMAAYVGLYAGVFCVACRQWREGNIWLRAALLGVVWYFLEWLRGWLLTGFPWMPLAAAFAPWPAALQGLAFVGAYGLGGVLAAKACLLGIAVQERRWHPAVVSLALLALMLGCGAWRLQQPDPQGRPVDVLLVQGNVDQNVKWVPALQKATAERYMALTESGLRRFADAGTGGVPVLVVWPETAMPFDFEVAPFTAAVRQFMNDRGCMLLTGAVGLDIAAGKYLNRAYLAEPGTAPLRWYEKEHLVPFGEYVPPGLDMDFLQGFMQGVGDFVPGKRTAPLRMGEEKASAAVGLDEKAENALVSGVLVCYETIFPELARKRVTEGATLLINISNDAWFGRTSAAEQHLQLSVLRAVEQGRMLARGTNTGFSAFVDSRGRVLQQGGLFRAESLGMRLTALNELTVFYALAPILPGLALVLGLALAYGLSRSRRSRR